jgi:hypothetical protein
MAFLTCIRYFEGHIIRYEIHIEMAKLDGIFQLAGTFQNVTTVNSLAYGKHIRKARTKYTFSEGMKRSSVMIKQANLYAKVFKDAIDPYRHDFRDGQLWPRLVSLFKTQLKEKNKGDFRILEHAELNKTNPLGKILATSTSAVRAGNTLDLQVTSRYCQDPTRKADGYQLTIIVLFVDDALQVKSFSESAMFSFQVPGEQHASWPVPEGATTAIVVLKCNFTAANKPLTFQKGMGMRVEKVVAIG